MIPMNFFLPVFAVAAVHAVAVVTPGANFLVVTRYALGESRRMGLATAAGVVGGSIVYITAGFWGITAVLAHSPWLFGGIKLVGALFLLGLGVRTLLAQGKRPAVPGREGVPATPALAIAAAPGPADARLTLRRAFAAGLLTNLSNPHSALYFLALFTTFITVTTPSLVRLVMAVVMVAISFSWYAIVALSFSMPRVRRVYSRVERWVNVALGGSLVLIGCEILISFVTA